MAISVGGVNIVEAVLNLEYELDRTQRILEWVVNNNAGIIGPSEADMLKINDRAVAHIQKKYPDAGIERKKSSKGA